MWGRPSHSIPANCKGTRRYSLACRPQSRPRVRQESCPRLAEQDTEPKGKQSLPRSSQSAYLFDPVTVCTNTSTPASWYGVSSQEFFSPFSKLTPAGVDRAPLPEAGFHWNPEAQRPLGSRFCWQQIEVGAIDFKTASCWSSLWTNTNSTALFK